ncbi:MAG: MFS transporter [Sediminibacterium sp.]|nr:MFS transporter [Sediminibacterium sp.]
MTSAPVSQRAHRWAVATFFFLAGLSFSSWASRIPDIKAALHMSDAVLGGVLFALPAGSMVSLLLSGWLLTRYGSKKVITAAAICYPLILIFIGNAPTIWQLVPFVFLYGLLGNICNISMNTQAVGVENLYGRSIMASFHGIWSLAGFTGAAIGTIAVSRNLSPLFHFCLIAGISILLILYIHQFTLPKDTVHTGQSFFVMPDRILFQLGLIAFSCMVCEGTMFDWSGVYFQKVVAAPKELTTLGYAAFMSTMAGGRFIGDRLVTKIGTQKVLQASGIIITAGLFTAVLFPGIVTATIGFLLVGIGVSSVIPLVYSAAGRSKSLSPGMALTAVSTIGFFGFLMGPPLIGFISQAFSLRWSFALIAIVGFGTTVLATKIKSW